ncbi:putative activating signal cointegrator 1 complex subunit 3 [Cardiosporidium cionae]|uniref:Activating signal cointegrator 1 complex subunit 3 n=1 Tax=Cardiosporidium cionae TaxID=476202 RepID=A0ABQ7J994_9APIC|nr:putative activating signal cointegrator 1 complex subunit 3 [Cardiosporidium cionae]|eukprot:KAF8820499.1 putative activating signal cointegrator 1 complex subunit 3 [Cardiosporidium cionae]
MFNLRAFTGEIEHTLHFTVPIDEPLPPNIFIRIISDRWIQSETTLPVSLKTLILPEKNPPHTDLLDLQPLPVTALRFPDAEALYSVQFKSFNPIQTQVFSTLYTTNENVLICAPPASGKSTCAEFAILRMMRHESIRRAVYVAPYVRTAKERFKDWSHKFGKLLGLTVNELSGEMQSDLKTLERSHLVVTTPAKWDFLSRRWKNRKVLQNINLFIVDELQLIDSDVGPSLEVCVSRMRYISAQLHSPIRLIGLACSIANAKDIGEWIGAGTNGFFNFHPNVRTIPLEISIHGFDIYHRQSRLLAMSKPVYQAIKHYSLNKPVIIFTPDQESMAQYLTGLREKTLQETLKYGVGYYHEGFTAAERGLVERLYESRAIQVLVTTEHLAWGLMASAFLVIVMDTKRFSGSGSGYVDYPIYDILQMMGCASRPRIDKNGVVVLLCHSSTKEYYKKFIFEPLPVESHLDQQLADYINAEIVLKTIENKQDAVDWLTWTFYYRRLTKNPNYYGLQGITHQHLSDHLSELIESTISVLEQSQCVSVEEDLDLQPLNLGLISAFYYIKYTTIETFNRSLWNTAKRKSILEILSAASEFDMVTLRAGEEVPLEMLARNLGLKFPGKDKINESHFKALVLLYAHFNRTSISTDLTADQVDIVEISLRLVQGLVDVISSNGWLHPALVAMELSQMIVQALTSSHSPLKQLPHFTSALIDQAKGYTLYEKEEGVEEEGAEYSIEDVFDFMNMEDENRSLLLKSLTQAQLVDVAKACNRYPVITVDYTIENSSDVMPGSSVKCTIQLERDMTDEAVGLVCAPFFPKEKDEQWWLVIGEPNTNSLRAIKRLTVTKPSTTVKLEFDAPASSGNYTHLLYLMSDSYLGCDQEYKFDLAVQ